MIREAVTALARNPSVAGALARTPVARDVVARVVGGEELDQVIPLISDLSDRGFHIALERVAPGVATAAEADEAAAGYAALVDAMSAEGLAGTGEVALFTESLGQGVAGGRPWELLSALADRARTRGVALQLGVGPLADIDQTLAWAEALRGRGDDVGITLPAILRSAEGLARPWSAHRVRLVKGAHAAGAAAYRQPIETDKAYVRIAKILLRGGGQPSFATHDPRLIEIVESLARRFDRPRHSYEFAFYLGRQVGEQERLLREGERVRIYVPYGHRWLERLVGGLAEQPGGVVGALRSLLPG
jgi:proline dehydrogenase